MERLKKKDRLYYARIIPTVGTYEVCDLIVRTVCDTWFVAIDKRDKHAYLFSYNHINRTVFHEREIALSNVKEAQKKASEIDFHIDYDNGED